MMSRAPYLRTLINRTGTRMQPNPAARYLTIPQSAYLTEESIPGWIGVSDARALPVSSAHNVYYVKFRLFRGRLHKRAPNPRRSGRLVKRTSQGCTATSSINADRSYRVLRLAYRGAHEKLFTVMRRRTMSKGMDRKKEAKQKPAKSPQEKRAAKREKKQSRGFQV